MSHDVLIMISCFFLKGTSAEQDNRFSNKHKKLLKQLKFAECLEKKVENMIILVFFGANVFTAPAYHKHAVHMWLIRL